VRLPSQPSFLSKFREQAAFSFNKEEVDLTIGVMDPPGAGEGAVPRNRPLPNLTSL
jgi:hypothetical protein